MESKIISRLIIPAFLAVGLLSGCTYEAPTTQGAALDSNTPRTVVYPGGRYQLYGDGSATSPQYWVWIPAGATPPPPPPLPAGRVTASTSSGGQYQLYGDGTSASPYYYVWVPAGTMPPPPPPPPRRPYP